ncbi:polysaccharide deacetylase family protein [Marinisporobacter balticus]|uniref:Peptidoglycan/xylan/chitin deacetylase (PgdA/CDA1 family) n=1 Tax=Marinisporobacter balticus TaxID=2018667 RepID=A0A4R2KRS8_9FIRM|nr:polysaccharide deacetylase family protein [Marinisporobacter balticus]TCO73679.1 peptidoglycan/xylan/chitin deacetylase (PgdA/CDA1 family) [Marinisporobacter balticus]
MNKKIIAFFILISFMLTGCATNASQTPVKEEEKAIVKTEKLQENQEKQKEEKKEIDLQKIKPNEAGQIMVLMYHSISEPEAVWTRTPENFRKDLQYLYDKGYRPISLKDYVTGNITTEAGYTPIVITFDDGWQNNFNRIQNEQGDFAIDPDCAVAILEDFNEKHPDFPLEATFFVNDNVPFGQKEHLAYKFQYIVDKGMDIGNHTATHVDYKEVNDEKRIQKELASVVKLVKKYLPDYDVNTQALPFGHRPKNEELYKYLESGSDEGINYKNIAILNVGWDPYKSPYHLDFNPLAIHRVRASDLQKYVQGVGMYDWLNHFDKGNRVRYISDGDSDIVTIPENYKEVIDVEKTANKEIRTYILEK